VWRKVVLCCAVALESSVFDHVTSSVTPLARGPLTLVIYAAPAIALDQLIFPHFGSPIPLLSLPFPFSSNTRPLRTIFVFNPPLPGLGQADNDSPLFTSFSLSSELTTKPFRSRSLLGRGGLWGRVIALPPSSMAYKFEHTRGMIR